MPQDFQRSCSFQVVVVVGVVVGAEKVDGGGVVVTAVAVADRVVVV